MPATSRRCGGWAGSAASHTRDQDEIARWHTEEAVLQMNRIARTEAAADGRTLVEHAQLFALLNVALADVATSVFEAKYTYFFWRPVTAIRHADEDANPQTRQDLVWSPFLPTPPHPEYPSAHAAVHSAGARVLTMYSDASIRSRRRRDAVPGVTRTLHELRRVRRGGEIGADPRRDAFPQRRWNRALRRA